MIRWRRALGRLFGGRTAPDRFRPGADHFTAFPREPPERLLDRAKAELRTRFARAERPTAWDYLTRLPRLSEDRALAVSLIYEEYCLLEEAGDCPDAAEFCRRYPQWRDSLELQLRCHRELGQALGEARPLPRPGDRFHGFRIVGVLGRGGTSQVYLAREEAMGGRTVALKISEDRGPEPAVIARLDHPRIMPGFSVCYDPSWGLRGLCMPYRSGLPLDALIRRAWPLRGSHGATAFWEVLAAEPASPGPAPALDWPGWHGFPVGGRYEQAAAWIALGICQAVSYMHAEGVVHCDIKPSNVYVSCRDGPLLFDFDFARSGDDPDPVAGGTLAYMAPEQLCAVVDPGPRAWAEVEASADIYAIGLTLVELLLGTLPDIPSPTLPPPRVTRELLDRRSRPGPRPWMATDLIPPALGAVLGRCLSPSPGMRYGDARALASALTRYLASATA
jgi:serine/threonine protein kinase